MRSITKILISSLIIMAIGALMLCTPWLWPAGKWFLIVGGFGGLASIIPIIMISLEDDERNDKKDFFS